MERILNKSGNEHEHLHPVSCRVSKVGLRSFLTVASVAVLRQMSVYRVLHGWAYLPPFEVSSSTMSLLMALCPPVAAPALPLRRLPALASATASMP